ncbi:MAG: exo-alpha-sialidase [Rhodospirillaceae bacterium]|nr:exo-alpha-sialidase [Rhodospirillaceae bacterium]
MVATLHVASRKGLLTFVPDGGGWRLDRTAFLGDPVTAVLPDGRDGALYAALNLGHFGVKLHRSDDGGTTWTELPAPAFPPADGGGDGQDGPSVSLIWTLAAGGTDRPGEIWAGTLPGGLFRSPDRGAGWSLVDGLWNRPERAEWFGGGYDLPGIHSICIDPRDSGRITVGVSCGGVWISDDGGTEWRLGGTGLRAAYMPPERAGDRGIQDPHRLVQCATAPDTVWCQHHNGIFRSADRGDTFTEITAAQPSAFGFAVAVHPRDPQTAWFVPAVKDECRVPVDGRLVVSRTRNGGASFDVLAGGLPQATTFDLVYRHALDVDADGRSLAMGTTTGNLWVADGGGERWTAVSTHLPPINQVAWAP